MRRPARMWVVSDAIRDDSILFSIPVVANNVGNRVFSDGDVTDVSINDAGFGHSEIPSVPALPGAALLGLAAALLAASRVARRLPAR